MQIKQIKTKRSCFSDHKRTVCQGLCYTKEKSSTVYNKNIYHASYEELQCSIRCATCSTKHCVTFCTILQLVLLHPRESGFRSFFILAELLTMVLGTSLNVIHDEVVHLIVFVNQVRRRCAHYGLPVYLISRGGLGKILFERHSRVRSC